MFRHLIFVAAITPMVHATQWYEEMKVGPARSDTFEDQFQGQTRVDALKGILVDLGDNYKVLFDTETLRMGMAYQGDFKWGGTPWTGEHGPLLGLKNENAIFSTAALPGWENPSGNFDDKREFPGHGNLDYATYKGYYRHSDKVTFQYSVRGTEILETLSRDGSTIIMSFQAAKRDTDLAFTVADEKGAFGVGSNHANAKSGDELNVVATNGVQLLEDPKTPGHLIAKIPKGALTTFQIALARGSEPKPTAAPDFKMLTAGGPPLYPEIIETKGSVSTDSKSPYVTDVVTLPENNPWKANLRFGGFDFMDEDSAALSSWNGDVWIVRGLKGDWSKLKWQRIASGLFQTLGLKVVKGVIYVHGRDQITQLIDLNGDGETDYFKVFNRDVLITKGFHEFAFDIQTDKQGNFYIAKAAPVRGGGRGFDAMLPHNGIVAKISPDGKKFEIIATGLRAPGGLGVGPNGEITTGENEGTWQPCCKINYFDGKTPVFLGTEPSRGALKNAPYTEPLCYLPMSVDNSSGSQVWTTETSKFGLPANTLLHLSYGQSAVYRVLPVARAKGIQGGVVKLPITLQASAMRARFHPDGSLYVLGFRGWQTNSATECAFERIRYNPGTLVPVPEKMEYTDTGIRLKFSAKLDPELAQDVSSYSSERWNYVRGPQYGSGEFSVDHPDAAAEKDALEKESKDHHVHDTVEIQSAKLLPDGQTVEIGLEGMKPAMTLKVTYDLEDKEADVLKGEVYATVYEK
ncbi:MAG: DUF6797 domain-containing protein [Luteolibacter sp.]